MLRSLFFFFFAVLAGCFPYREDYRPKVSGVVVGADGGPVANARVEACSASKWQGLREGCPREAEATTDAAGRFSLPGLREWEWCCFGEAPLPFTLISACGP